MAASSSTTDLDAHGTPVLIWLDAHVNEDEKNKQAQQELCSIINRFQSFEDQKQCQKYILSVPSYGRIILIVSGQLGRQIVPQIHHLQQLLSVYVYCMNKESNEKWAKDFTKVRAVVVTLKDLIAQIRTDENPRLKVEEPITITVFTAGDNPDQSTTELNGDFLHSLLLIDALLLLKPNENDKKTLMTFVQNKYKGREKEITNLKKFESTYSPDEVLWWYSYQTVLYKILNEALRMQNIDSLLLFRFFIADIYDQLKQNQYDSPIQVYRGQLMSINELKKLEKSKGKLISINSFFSTSRVRNEAMRFLEEAETSGDLCLVLFTIDADPKVVTTKPFADISSFAEYKDEAEVLFMIACIFRLDSIHQRKDDRWEIHMTLCGDDVHDLKELYEHTKNEYWGNDQEIDLITFGEVLYHMGKYSSAEKLYLRMLQELPADNLSLSKLYYHLGMIAYKKEDYNSSLTWYDKSLKIILKINSSNYTNIGELYNCIGEAHRGKNDYDQALEWHKKGIECLKNAHQENHPTMGILYNNIGLIYQGQENYAEALKYYKKSLTINEKYLPPGHADMATLHHNLSIVYGYLSQYDLAIEHHNKSLEIKLKAFPSSHPSIADSYQSIGCLYYDKGEWKQALKNFQKAADIYHHSLSSDHPKVLRIESNIERVKSKLK